MTYDFQILYTGSNPVYVIIDQLAPTSDGDLAWSGQTWNVTGTPALETFNTAHWSNYVVTLTSLGGGLVVGSKPAGVTGDWQYVVYEQQAGSPASSDVPIGLGSGGPSSRPSTPAGPGADQVTVTITDGDNPVPDAEVWISSDAPGVQVVAGPLTTNSAGQAKFLLTAGLTYYLWMERDGVNPILGQSFVAVAD